MKLFILCMFALVTCSAASGYSQELVVSLDLKQSDVGTLFREIRRQTGLRFVYNEQHARSLPRFDLKCENASVATVLDDVFRSTDLQWSCEEDVILVTARPQTRPQQQYRLRPVRGTVTDERGAPLPGVTVMLKGTTTGTATRPDGNYSINVPDNAEGTLIFSCIGFRPVEKKVQFDEPLNVKLEEAIEELDDVVVTGIFNKPKESYTGAVSVITSQQLELYRAQNLLQTIKNIDASLYFAVDNVSGSDPNKLPQITIRGNASLPMNVEEFNASQSNAVNTPLIIMDGFEISLTKLMDYNDEEISSINILKDAAATAIYGSRGANGVIVIITKQPQAGKLRFNVDFGTDIEAPNLTSYDLLNAAEKLELEKRVGLYNSTNVSMDLQYKQVYNNRLRTVLSGVDTDWLSKPLRTGLGLHGNMRLEGGSQEFRWSATGSWKDTQGTMKESTRQNFNGGITLIYSVKNMKFQNNTSVTVNSSKESPFGAFSDYVRLQPYNTPYDENGKIIRNFERFRPGSSQIGNPLYNASLKSFNKSGYLSLTNNFSLEWNPIESLRVRGSFGITTKNETKDVFKSAEHSEYLSEDANASPEAFMRRGSYTFTTGNSNNYSGNATVSYTKTLSDKHQLYFAADYSMRASSTYKYTFILEGFASEDMSFPGNARQYEQDGKPDGSSSRTTSLGVTANANYTYFGRYYADLSYRVDGSSSFGTERQYAPFWSAGIGWNVHSESFMKQQTLFDNLRLRLSYGITGSQDESTGALTTYEHSFDNKYMAWTGTILQGWGNPKLTWQSTRSFNLGLEWSMWDGFFKGDVNVYTKHTSNLLSSLEIPASMGFTSYAANIGAVKNTGWELSSTVYLIRNREKRFNLLVSGQLMHNNNKIVKLSEAVKEQNEVYIAQNVEVSRLFYEGRPQNSLYAVRSLGIDPSTGLEIFLDRDGNIVNTYEPANKVYIGSGDPLFRGRANAMLQYKGFTLNLALNYYWGGKTENTTLRNKVEVTANSLMSNNVDSRVLYARWQEPGDLTFFKRIDNTATRATSRFVMDDNTLEISSISLQYRWDSEWVRKSLRMNSINFSVNMSDIAHWSTIKQERGTSYPYAHNIQGSIKLLF